MSKKFILIFLLLALNFLFVNFVFSQTLPSCPIPRPTLSRGSQGDCVRFLQQSLNSLIGANLAVDGIFGTRTEDAVATYQQLNNLRSVDGIVGAETWGAINRELTGQQTQPQTQQLPGYNLPPLPTGTGYTQGEIQGLLIKFANFLIGAGVILGIITIVVSGIMYFKAGSDTDAKNAKAWFKNGIIGAFIILSVGVIILTIYNIVVTRTFFGGPSIPGPGPAGPITGGPPGAPCTSNSQCVSGTTCDTVSGMCVRSTGNLEGEPCRGDGDCSPDLRCKSSGIFGTGPKTCQKP